jgi:hypothetical protein
MIYLPSAMITAYNLALIRRPIAQVYAFICRSLLSQAHSLLLWYLYLLTYSVALVRKRTIPTDRPPLVGEVSVKLLRIESATWSP